jgi:hypothetical protein
MTQNRLKAGDLVSIRYDAYLWKYRRGELGLVVATEGHNPHTLLLLIGGNQELFSESHVERLDSAGPI